MKFYPGALSILIAAAAPALAAQSLPRQPAGQWVVDFDDAQCVASRDYGTSEKPLVLALKVPPLGDVIEVALLRRGGGGRYAEQVEGWFGVDDGEPSPLSMLVFAAGEPKHRVVRAILPAEQFSPARSASSIHVRAKGELNERLAISQLESVMKLMEECVADLRRVWNVTEGEETVSVLKERAKTDFQGLFRGDDYPDAALEGDQQGSVQMALLIDEQGRIADCTVVQTSGVAILDGQACAIARERAKFTPAAGPDGRPAKDGHLRRVRWRLAR